MNIKILDSWLRDYLKTKATPEKIGELLSLSSVSVEKIEEFGKDLIYDFEVTTNRPDLMSVLGIAREAAAILPQFGIRAEFVPPVFKKPNQTLAEPINIINDPKLVNRCLAVALDVVIKPSAKEVSERLETSGIRSLNNVIDITNYVMRVIGHPTHVFDLDRLNSKNLTIREASKGEQIQTLDNKIYSLKGGEIIAANDQGEIVDLLGIMGLSNSVVTNETKRILFFINNNDPYHMRKTSMELAIRTEAATLNEKAVDPQTSLEALILGVELFEKYAEGKNISKIIDIYPNRPKPKTISVSTEKINKVIGVKIDLIKIRKALEVLGFKTSMNKDNLSVDVPSFRLNDITIAEDVIEEIARIYGYYNLPSILPPLSQEIITRPQIDRFYWEEKLKTAMKYWGFIQTYTYSFVSEEMFEGPVTQAVEIANPLTKDYVYMRNTLVPSLLEVIANNRQFDEIKIFETANVYLKRENDLPEENLNFAGIIRTEKANFFKVKGLVEQILNDLGITDVSFKQSQKGGLGTTVYIKDDYLGEIEILDSNLIDFELNFEVILKYASNKKTFKPFAKYPPVTADLTIIDDNHIPTQELIIFIQKASPLVSEIELKDSYKTSRTFHIVFQDPNKNLTQNEISLLLAEIVKNLKNTFGVEIK